MWHIMAVVFEAASDGHLPCTSDAQLDVGMNGSIPHTGSLPGGTIAFDSGEYCIRL